MFNAEPQETWTREEAAEFAVHAAARLSRMWRSALWSLAAFVLNVAALFPFLRGHSLQPYWERFGKPLLLTAYPVMLWLLYRSCLVWSSWLSARETRREYGDPL